MRKYSKYILGKNNVLSYFFFKDAIVNPRVAEYEAIGSLADNWFVAKVYMGD